MVHTFDVSKTLHIGYMMPQHTAPYIRRRCRFPFSPLPSQRLPLRPRRLTLPWLVVSPESFWHTSDD